MSKLSERIRRAGRVEPAPLGFATIARARVPSMLTLVRLSSGEAGKAGEAAKAGADAVIFEGDPGKLKDAGDAVIGVQTGKTGRKAAEELRDAGVDFLVVDTSSPAEAMLDEKLGFVLELREEMDDTHLRLLAELNLDALVLAAPEAPITLAKLLEFRRVAGLARAPVLVEAGPDIDPSLLQVLRESGAAGVIIPASAVGKLDALRERIGGLPARGGRRREEERAQPLVPAQAMAGGHDEDDYDDED